MIWCSGQNSLPTQWLHSKQGGSMVLEKHHLSIKTVLPEVYWVTDIWVEEHLGNLRSETEKGGGSEKRES